MALRQREHFEKSSADRAREMHSEIVNLERDAILVKMDLKSAQASIAELTMTLAQANQENEELKTEIFRLKEKL